MKPSFIVALTVLCYIDTVRGDSSFGDFLINIPNQVEHAWETLKDVIREPVRERRLSRVGILKATTESAQRFPINQMRALPRIPFVFDHQTTTLSPKQKVHIPLIQPKVLLTNEVWVTKHPGYDRRLNAFQSAVNGSLEKLLPHPVDPTLTSRRKIEIPIMLDPNFRSLNGWNNMRSGWSSRRHEIINGTSRKTIMEFFYGVIITGEAKKSDQ